MKLQDTSTLDIVRLFTRAVRDLAQNSTGNPIHVAKTVMRVTGIQINGDIGAFVAFRGDYSGIMVLNFEAQAALEIVSESLLRMGFPEDEIPTHHGSDEVRSNMGELVNQAVGKCRSLVEEKYDLTARANIPAVVPITVPIALTMVAKEPAEMECVRVAFTTSRRNKFYMELALEPILGEPLEQK
ncbi:MAG: chemotaxis protein CheX [Candidatus Nitrospinota bacterium M3_3B_026]